MAADYDTCRVNLEEFVAWYESQLGARNEATTRLQLIDRLFFNCLGWDRSDASLEVPQGREYADYTFAAPRQLLIVEAKKEGDYFEIPAGKDRLEYSIISLSRDNQSLKRAIEQAAGYCQSRGVPFGVVSNGWQLVAFIGNRSDGVPPVDGKALVFPSLDFMLSSFLDLWQALSKPGIEEKNLRHRLIGGLPPELPPKMSQTIPEYPRVKRRNDLQAELQSLSELVIEDLPRSEALEARFMEECYSPGGALSRFALLSKNILQARYAALFGSETPGPTTTPVVDKGGISPEIFAQSLSRRPIILIGDVGVGKTMFIRHLIKVDAAELFENAVTLYIDLGSQAAIATDIRIFVLNEIARQLRENYDVNVKDRKFVRGIYNRELREDFADGIYADLRDINPSLYKQKEIEFLEEKIDDQEQHLKRSLEHLANGRQQQIVVFIDNADQRDEGTQQSAFLIAQELAERWPGTVFVALRPDTFHRSLQIGALSGYHPKAFTIAPPRIDRVVEKRLDFALEITSGQIPLKLPSGTVLVNLDRMDAIIRVFCSSLERNDQLRELIDNIPNGNVRLALDLIRGFFGSGHVDTRKIMKIYEESGQYLIPLHEFLRAVMFGDNVYYDPTRSDIANLFDVTNVDRKEHFLLPLTIGTVSSIGTADEGFIETAKVYDQLQALGFTPEQIDSSIVRGYRKKLIEASGRRIPYPAQGMPQALRTTTVGLYHINRLCRMFTYVDAMLVDVPIFDQQVRESIKNAGTIGLRADNVETFRQYLDDCWSLLDSTNNAFNWSDVSAELKDDIRRVRMGAERASSARK
jgi:hypothetical protein